MLSSRCMQAYAASYPLDRCGLDEETETVIIERADGLMAVREPAGETGTVFLKRLDRCRKTGRNLFFTEWDRYLTERERRQTTPDLCRTCVELYQQMFPEDRIIAAPRGKKASIYWADPRYTDGLFLLVEPDTETNASFYDRLQRSRAEGRNLFHEEWPLG